MPGGAGRRQLQGGTQPNILFWVGFGLFSVAAATGGNERGRLRPGARPPGWGLCWGLPGGCGTHGWVSLTCRWAPTPCPRALWLVYRAHSSAVQLPPSPQTLGNPRVPPWFGVRTVTRGLVSKGHVQCQLRWGPVPIWTEMDKELLSIQLSGSLAGVESQWVQKPGPCGATGGA